MENTKLHTSSRLKHVDASSREIRYFARLTAPALMDLLQVRRHIM